MIQPWTSVVAELQRRKGIGDEAWEASAGSVRQLATRIAEGPLNSLLFGWLSMHDLCIQQTDAPPYSVPYLRVSPSLSGDVEFHYFDTDTRAKQWHRTVPPHAVPGRFKAFLDQLHWITSKEAVDSLFTV